jgi:hypothetical protein
MENTTMPWPQFEEDETVIGWPLLGVIDWVCKSNSVLNGEPAPEGMSVITMPPVQRSAVWRPKQVVDLWDSLMRGLPIGTFCIVSAKGPRDVVDLRTDETQHFPGEGFDLLDGQQRVRALLVGAVGFPEEKRCLWVDLGAKEARQRPCLHLTSKAQPFGYDPNTGVKLGLEERRTARMRIEPRPEYDPIRCDDGRGGLRPAYDLDLFDGPVTQNGAPLQPQPPLPYGATEGLTFKLPELLRLWRTNPDRDAESRIAALRAMVGERPTQEALTVLHESFRRAEKAHVALMRVDPASFRSPDQDLLALFERIGAGGTALSVEERLFSIYKYHVPRIRDTVDMIYIKAGRVLPPTKIAATALRIANARTTGHPTHTPGVVDFAEAMAAKSELWQKLEEIIPVIPRSLSETGGSLSQGFVVAKSLLAYHKDAGEFWIPDVLLTALPAELWQVLVLWATSHPPEAANLDLCRQEMVRLSLFWHLLVDNNDKATRWAFEYINDNGANHAVFPGLALYRRFAGTIGGDSCAHALIEPTAFEQRLCKEPPIAAWRTDAERFVENDKRNVIGSHWWWYGKKLLPWLQKDYIHRVFPDYAPLTDQEDDLPYDVDHICPWSDCGNWRLVRDRVDSDENTKKRMHDERGAIGDGIGNLRLIDSSVNRHHQDVDISVKMPFVLSGEEPGSCDQRAMADWAFATEHRALWNRVSRPGPVAGRRWNDDRLGVFQEAVEKRAAWLYRRFYEDLRFSDWVEKQTPVKE